MDEEFGENPFSKLDLSRFKKAEPIRAKNEPTIEERRLFQTSWDRMPASKRADKPRSGFTLAEQCALPVIKMKKKKPKEAIKPAQLPKKSEESPEDLFMTAMRNTRPLKNRGRDIAPKPKLRQHRAAKENTLADFMAGKLEFAITSSNEYLEGYVVGLDELILNRLREGQFSPEANLDLHGLNAEQAFEALRVFIRNAWLKDLRSVLVVTGRGRNSPDGQAVLRQKLQGWLTKEPFKRVVAAFCTAKPHDGGPGAIYILLRRFRKKGPILWERLFIEDEDI